MNENSDTDIDSGRTKDVNMARDVAFSLNSDKQNKRLSLNQIQEDYGLSGDASDSFQERLLNSAESAYQAAHHIDSMTGLLSRKGMDAWLTAEVLKVKRLQFDQNSDEFSRYSMAIFFGDLNSFKVVNDELGHDEGDKILMSVVEVLDKTFREKTSRWGGDEFVAMLPTSAESMPGILSRLAGNLVEAKQQDIANRPRLSEPIFSNSMTMSAGYVVLSGSEFLNSFEKWEAIAKQGKTLESFAEFSVKKTDDLMYMAKNQVHAGQKLGPLTVARFDNSGTVVIEAIQP